jgi:hypothetical protein
MNDQQLLLYALDEGLDANERLAIAAALAGNTELSARLQHLRADLDALRGFTDIAPDDAAQRRWLAALARAERVAAAPRRGVAWSWIARPALLATLVGGLLGGWVLVQQRAPSAPVAVLPHHAGDVLLRGMQQQFDDSQTVLAALGQQPVNDPALIDELIAQHRVFERLAEQNGEHDLARVLRAMEPMLLALDRQGDAADRAELRAQLQFELAAMQTKMTATPSKTLPMQSL